MDLEPRENTPAMEAVIQMRAQRLAAGICTPITPEPSDEENDTEIGTVVKVRLITQWFLNLFIGDKFMFVDKYLVFVFIYFILLF